MKGKTTMKLYSLIGHPLGHSMSPMIHKRLFELGGKSDSFYALTDISPEELPQSGEALRSFCGFNVTIPHKTAVIPLLDRLEESAVRYNAVNCVKNDGGQLIGYNTDCDGFLESARFLPLSENVLLLGCGGAGRMMAIEAALHGASLTIAIRPQSVKKGQLLMAEILAKCSGASVRLTDINSIDGKYDLMLNATPVGMYPDTEGCPVSDEMIANCSTFFDAVYNPTETALIKKARAMGKTAVGGAAMLVYQAVKAHEIWDGDSYQREKLTEIINAVEESVDRMNAGSKGAE